MQKSGNPCIFIPYQRDLAMKTLCNPGMLLLLIMLTNTGIMSQQPAQDVFTVIHNRKSVRQYADKPVEREKVETLLKAAMAAPTARNIQPWLFYVITSRKVLDQLAADLPYAKMLAHAPMAIVVAGDTHKGNPNQEQKLNWSLDCSAATQNLLLAAEALGLGAVWTGVFPYSQRIEAVSQALQLPPHIIPLNVIPLGYPATEEQPKDKWDSEKIKWID